MVGRVALQSDRLRKAQTFINTFVAQNTPWHAATDVAAVALECAPP